MFSEHIILIVWINRKMYKQKYSGNKLAQAKIFEVAERNEPFSVIPKNIGHSQNIEGK